jgi:peptide/nickel transport system substrate-binding protein
MLATSLFVLAAALFPRLGLGQAAPVAGSGGEANLLKIAPFDKITLPDNTVIRVEPVSPRPLPPLQTKKQRSNLDA